MILIWVLNDKLNKKEQNLLIIIGKLPQEYMFYADVILFVYFLFLKLRLALNGRICTKKSFMTWNGFSVPEQICLHAILLTFRQWKRIFWPIWIFHCHHQIQSLQRLSIPQVRWLLHILMTMIITKWARNPHPSTQVLVVVLRKFCPRKKYQTCWSQWKWPFLLLSSSAKSRN